MRMFLSVGPTPEFLKFIQVLSWILLPILVSAILTTWFVHYRRKKTGVNNIKKTEDEFMQATPELVGYTKGDGEYILFDHSQLIQEYKHRLTSNHARFSALQHDHELMQASYTALALYTKTLATTEKKQTMDASKQQMPGHIQDEINKLLQQHEREKKELHSRLSHLGLAFHELEEENRVLHEQITIGSAPDDQKKKIIDRWKEENAALRDKVAEHDFVNDVLEEKKAQILFLQLQLEQRIKDNHRGDQYRATEDTEIEELKENNRFIYQQAEVLKTELQLKQDQADKLQSLICEMEEQLIEKDRLLLAKEKQVNYFENLLVESRLKNELLNASASDGRQQLNDLQQQLSDIQSRIQSLRTKTSSEFSSHTRL